MSTLDAMVLVPRPRRIEVTGRRGPRIEGLIIEAAPDPTVTPQGFRLTISSSADGVRIEHRDPAGLRYARQTLDQITTQSTDGYLPAVRIEDRPDIATRGLMLDISRDRVPTRATLERIVELASLARLNQLQLYMEHTFAYRDHREVWHRSSPMTAADISWLDEHCAAHGVELSANQNCFGHMGRWLSHPTYRARAEAPDGWELMPGVTMPPSVLAPTADNAAFAHRLLDELLASFQSRKVHIGCDEPFDLGKGASRDIVARHGVGQVYVDHVRRLAEPLAADGYQVQIWADVLRRHPELAAQLPAGVEPIAWCYEAPTPDGRPLDLPPGVAEVMVALGTDASAFSGFALQVAPLVEADVDFWVAPGTSSWSSLVGRIDNAQANLCDAAEAARAHGAEGYLIADWGDNGHHQPPSVSFGPIVYGGAVAWGLEANRHLDLGAVLDRHVFAEADGVLSGVLDSLGRLWARTGQRAVNASPLNAALFPEQVHLVMGQPDRSAMRDVVDEIDAALTRLTAASPACDDGETVVRELTQAARMARHGAWRMLGEEGPGARALGDDMAQLVEGQRTSWLDRARPGGLADSLARLDPTLAAAADIPDPGAG